MMKRVIGLMFIIFFVTALSCDGDSEKENTETKNYVSYIGDYPSWHEITDFELINSFRYATHLNILYSDSFSGDIQYIVSSIDLGITTETEFISYSSASLTIFDDGAVYNNYIDITQTTDGTLLAANTEYYVYILSDGIVKSFTKTTESYSPSYTTVTGTAISDGVSSYTYTLYFPACHASETDKSFPLMVSIKSSSVVTGNPDFPCVAFSIPFSNTTRSRMDAFLSNLATAVTSVINNRSYRIDKNKLYASGYSVGANLVLELANNLNGKSYMFNAVVGLGVGGGANTNNSGNMCDTSVWFFAGEKDTTFLPLTTNYYNWFTANLTDCSAEYKFEIIPGADHNFTGLWLSPYIYMWFLSK